MASQYKRVKLSKTGVVSATRIAGEEGGLAGTSAAGTSAAAEAQDDKGDDLRDVEDEDDELQLASASKRPTGRRDVLDDEDSDEGAPDPAQKQEPKKLSAGASTSKGKKGRREHHCSDGEVLPRLRIHCCNPWTCLQSLDCCNPWTCITGSEPSQPQWKAVACLQCFCCLSLLSC